jgi:quercetin dioxygenase-like cupin family protein
MLEGAVGETPSLPETIRIGGLEIRFLESGASTTGGGLDVFEMTVQPNARVPVPHHHENWEETIYGLAGALTFDIGDRHVTLMPGQTAFIPRGVVHGFRNDGPEAGKCLCILTPGVLGPGYFREMAALVAQTPPDLTRMKETMLRYGLIPVLPAPAAPAR